MSNNIFEELPSRKDGAAQPMGDAAASVEKKARQLVYDSRYEVKKLLAGKKADSATQERMVLERIAKSTAIPAVKARARLGRVLALTVKAPAKSRCVATFTRCYWLLSCC